MEVKWNNRQYTIPRSLHKKIENGATRNLVIRGAAGTVDQHDVRDHMEHIHQLSIISIKVFGADMFINTNSVRNALFAKTCMQSRVLYKRYSIDFMPDECAASLPAGRQFGVNSMNLHNRGTAPTFKPAHKLRTSVNNLKNRFHLLDVNSEDTSSESCFPHRRADDSDDIDGSQSGTSLGHD